MPHRLLTPLLLLSAPALAGPGAVDLTEDASGVTVTVDKACISIVGWDQAERVVRIDGAGVADMGRRGFKIDLADPKPAVRDGVLRIDDVQVISEKPVAVEIRGIGTREGFKIDLAGNGRSATAMDRLGGQVVEIGGCRVVVE